MKNARSFSVNRVKFTDDWISEMTALFQLPPTHINSPSNLVSVKGSNRRLTIDSAKKIRKAAVLVPICNRNGVASVLLTVRSETVSTHKVCECEEYFGLSTHHLHY